jgi:hypothetical protein
VSDLFGGPPESDEPTWDEDIYGAWDERWAEQGQRAPDWWNETYTMYGEDTSGDYVTFQEHTLTMEQWYELTLTDSDFTEENYGMSVRDIIDELEWLDLWGPEDWDYWRELYE